jgi:hypothetical protein
VDEELFTIYRSLIIQHLNGEITGDEKSVVLFIYCTINATYTVETLFKSLLGQLLRHIPEVSPECVKSLRKYCRSNGEILFDDIKKLFISEIKRLGMTRVFIAVDGFDEIQSKNVQHDTLVNLHRLTSSHSSIRLVLVSRLLPLIEHMTRTAMKVEIFAQDQDIEIFISAQINQSIFLQHLIQEEPSLQEEIVQAVTEHAAGMSVP